MLAIINMEHHQKQLKAARVNGTFDDLLINLEYLHLYGGLEDPKRHRVELGYDMCGYSVGWYRWDEEEQKYKFWMNGGLIFHEKALSWSVHT